MTEQETQPLELLPGIHTNVLIYSVKAGQEGNIKSLCTKDIDGFLAQGNDATRADFWTVTLNVAGQPHPVTLLVSAVDIWGSEWGKKVANVNKYVDPVTVTAHPTWNFDINDNK